MDIRCPKCLAAALPAGHEDGRAFYQCLGCACVWATDLSAVAGVRKDGHGDRMPRVLVADDSPEILGLMASWLEDRGCVVVTASSGREALEVAVAYYPDVAFLDVVLPPPGGFELCEIFKRRLGPEIILMTGYSTAENARRAAGLDVVALLIKPFELEAANEALTAALERCRRDPLSGLRGHFGSLPRL
jgi:CheY-like chemotaxis protein